MDLSGLKFSVLETYTVTVCTNICYSTYYSTQCFKYKYFLTDSHLSALQPT